MTYPCSNCNRDEGSPICTLMCGRARTELPHQHEGDTALAVGNLIYALGRWKASKPGAEKEWPALVDACAALVAAARPAYTEGHCAEKRKPGGCQLHNLHCGYPKCDRKPA